MTIGINCGHTASGPGYGAVGIIKESEHTRLVGHALMGLFRQAGVTVIDCTVDKAGAQQEYLAATVALANRQDLDWFISIHFNASKEHTGHGAEIYTYKGRQYPDALEVCANLTELGFKNRGVKEGTGLYVIQKTKAKSMLIEVCFCDNQQDIDIYQATGGAEGIAKAIYKGIYKKVVLPVKPNLEENHHLDRQGFHEFVGRIAQSDWREHHIVLPSVVIAQAAIESSVGASELAQNANALFGIKLNGWAGRIYIKDAVEQNPDGSYRVDKNEQWRAYDSWEQSILDHNEYIATRSTDGGKTLRYGPVIGCSNYILACQYLKQCGYATAENYEENLINYIEKYGLHQYDEFEPEQIAPEGHLWIVQAGAYKSLNNAKRLQNKLKKMGVVSLIKIYQETFAVSQSVG